jgi:hypothetical protein
LWIAATRHDELKFDPALAGGILLHGHAMSFQDLVSS